MYSPKQPITALSLIVYDLTMLDDLFEQYEQSFYRKVIVGFYLSADRSHNLKARVLKPEAFDIIENSCKKVKLRVQIAF